MDATCRSIKEACKGAAFYRLNPQGAELLAGCARFRLHLSTRVRNFDAQLIVWLVTQAFPTLVRYRRLENSFSSDITISEIQPLNWGHGSWDKVKRIKINSADSFEKGWLQRMPNVVDVKFVGYCWLSLEGLEFLQKLESLELRPGCFIQFNRRRCTFAPETPVGCLPKLKRLVLGDCFIKDFSIFGFMPSLTFLDVSVACEIDSMGPLLQNCPALREIRADSEDLSLIDHIKKVARVSEYFEGRFADSESYPLQRIAVLKIES